MRSSQPYRAGSRGTMTTSGWSVRQLPSLDDKQIQELVEVLIDCVEGGAAVGFMKPLTRERALAFWRRVADGVVAGNRRAVGRRG